MTIADYQQKLQDLADALKDEKLMNKRILLKFPESSGSCEIKDSVAHFKGLSKEQITEIMKP
jgi:hypothetical protein